MQGWTCLYDSVWVRNLFQESAVSGDSVFLEGMRVDLALDWTRTDLFSSANVLGVDVSFEPVVYKALQVRGQLSPMYHDAIDIAGQSLTPIEVYPFHMNILYVGHRLTGLRSRELLIGRHSRIWTAQRRLSTTAKSRYVAMP